MLVQPKQRSIRETILNHSEDLAADLLVMASTEMSVDPTTVTGAATLGLRGATGGGTCAGGLVTSRPSTASPSCDSRNSSPTKLMGGGTRRNMCLGSIAAAVAKQSQAVRAPHAAAQRGRGLPRPFPPPSPTRDVFLPPCARPRSTSSSSKTLKFDSI